MLLQARIYNLRPRPFDRWSGFDKSCSSLFRSFGMWLPTVAARLAMKDRYISARVFGKTVRAGPGLRVAGSCCTVLEEDFQSSFAYARKPKAAGLSLWLGQPCSSVFSSVCTGSVVGLAEKAARIFAVRSGVPPLLPGHPGRPQC